MYEDIAIEITATCCFDAAGLFNWKFPQSGKPCSPALKFKNKIV